MALAMIDDLLSECHARGYHLSYLHERDEARGPYTWEAMIRAPIIAPRINELSPAPGSESGPTLAEGASSHVYRYTTGYGCGHSAEAALDSAMTAILRDPRYPAPWAPAKNYAPSSVRASDSGSGTGTDLFAILANLRKPASNPFKQRL